MLPPGRRRLVPLDEIEEDLEVFEKPLFAEVAALYHREHIAARLPDVVGYDPERIAIYDGDLRIDGDLDTQNERLSLLVVRGDLEVTGRLDDGEGETFVLVTGKLRARDVITIGWLDVHGDAEIRGSLVGDYNDHSAWFGGAVTCDFFYPEKHHFEFTQPLVARHQLAELDPTIVRITDDRITDDHGNLDGEIYVEMGNFKELKRRLRENRSIFPPRS